MNTETEETQIYTDSHGFAGVGVRTGGNSAMVLPKSVFIRVDPCLTEAAQIRVRVGAA